MYATTKRCHEVDEMVRRASDTWSVCSELFRVSTDDCDEYESDDKDLRSPSSVSTSAPPTTDGWCSGSSSDESEYSRHHKGDSLRSSEGFSPVHFDRRSVGSCMNASYECCCSAGLEDEDERMPVVYSLMLQKVFTKITKDDMVKFIKVINFHYCVDYFYLPFNLHGGKNKGMAFIKFRSPQCVRAFVEICNGLTSADILDMSHVTPQNITTNSLDEILTLRKHMNKRRQEHTVRKYKRSSPACVFIKMSPSKKQTLREHLFEKSRSKNITNPKFMPVVFRNGDAVNVTEEVKCELLIAEEVKDMLMWCREGEV